MKPKEIELLNSEGPVLVLVKINENEFVIYDKANSIVEVLSKTEIMEFIHGELKLQDSLGKWWMYKDQPKDMKPDPIFLDEFILNP
jgi:hypothetical protein